MAGDPDAAVHWLWAMVVHSQCTGGSPPRRVSDECDNHEHLCSWMWQLSLSPVRDGNGETAGLTGHATDMQS